MAPPQRDPAGKDDDHPSGSHHHGARLATDHGGRPHPLVRRRRTVHRRTTGLVGRPEGDAAAIAGFRWEELPGVSACGRIARHHRPGTPQASVRSDLGLVRIDFGNEVEHTVLADAVMDTKSCCTYSRLGTSRLASS